MTKLNDVRSDYNDFWDRAQTQWQTYLRAADLSLKAYTGRTWTNDEIESLRLENRVASEFNIIRPKVQFYSGFARDNMKSVIVGPQESGDQETADQLSEVMRYVYEKGDANAVQLNAFDDCLKTGISLAGISLDYQNDRVFGDIKFWRRGFQSFLIDPDFENPDLSDASEVLIRDFMTRDAAKARLPFIDPKEIDLIPTYSRDNKFTLLRNNETFFKNTDLLSFDSYYRKVSKRVHEIIDLDTGATTPIYKAGEELEEIKERVAMARDQGVAVQIQEAWREVVELNILLSGIPVYTGPDPLGLEDYPFVPFLCHWEPQLNKFELKLQGVPFGMIDTQRAFNKRMLRKEDVMDSVVNTGGLYHPGAIDVGSIYQSGAAKYIPVDDNWEFANAFQPLQQGQIPAGWQEETELLNRLSFEISGLNETVMGSDEGGNTQVSGRLAEVRVANSLRANRTIFDNFERSMKLLGKKVLRAIQINYGSNKEVNGKRDVGKIVRILNKEPTLDFFDPMFVKYDASVKEAVLSQTQRDAFYFELLQLFDKFGPDFIDPSMIVENLPMAGASEIKKAIEQKEQQRQQAAQMQEEDRQRNAALQDAVTDQNVALAQERRARVLSDIGLARERVSRSVENRQDAVLSRAKAMAELEQMDTDRLKALIDLVGQFEEMFSQKEETAIATDIAREQQLAGPQGQSAQQQQETFNQGAQNV